MKYEFLENKDFSPQGFDVVSVRKGDKVDVPDHLSKGYLNKKIIKKIDGVDYSQPVKQKSVSSKELEEHLKAKEQLHFDLGQLDIEKNKLKADISAFEKEKKAFKKKAKKENKK